MVFCTFRRRERNLCHSGYRKGRSPPSLVRGVSLSLSPSSLSHSLFLPCRHCSSRRQGVSVPPRRQFRRSPLPSSVFAGPATSRREKTVRGTLGGGSHHPTVCARRGGLAHTHTSAHTAHRDRGRMHLEPHWHAGALPPRGAGCFFPVAPRAHRGGPCESSTR